jgi:hypothetical protein
MFLRLRRRSFGISEPAVTRDHAIELAREECERAGSLWKEPVRSVERLDHYVFGTAMHQDGGNVCTHVDAQTGKARIAGVVPMYSSHCLAQLRGDAYNIA